MALGYFDTPRQTQLWMNLPNTVLGRHPWTLQRSAKHIRQQREIYKQLFGGLFNAGHVLNVNGDAWIIMPFGHDPAQTLTADGGYITSAEITLASNHRSYNSFRKTTTPGADQSGDLLTVGAPVFQRRRAAGASLADGNLDADLAGLPQPPSETSFTPMDRIMSGLVHYPSNQPYLLNFQSLGGAQDVIATFYFGGMTEVFPATESGGLFCLTLRTSGFAILYEFDQEIFSAAGDPWVPVNEFAWDRPARAGITGGLVENQSIFLVPYGLDRLALMNLGAGVSAAGGGFTLGGLLQTLASAAIEHTQGVPIRLFKHHTTNDDHRHLSYMTGAGPVRVDRPRTDRLPFSVIHLHYLTTAFLIDAPFFIDINSLPLATPLTLTLNGYTPPGTSIIPTIYDGTTGIALLRTGDLWLTNLGQRVYFVGFEFRSDGDPDATPPVAEGEQTPVLFGYTVYCPPGFESVEATPVKTARLTGLSVSGPGISCGEENASVQVNDEVDEAGILRVRDQMRSKLVICNRANGVPMSVLFEGQTASPRGKLRGVPGTVYPDPDWTQYNTQLTGMWPRLARQFAFSIFSFASSENSPHPAKSLLSDTTWDTWRLTDSLRYVANWAGVPDSQLDIPDQSFRWPASVGLSPNEYTIWPGTQFQKFLEDISRDFLGQLWLRDPNCGLIDSSALPSGMWRLRPNPADGSTNYLFTIDLDAPPAAAGPYLPMREGAHGFGVLPALKDTWETWTKAAEGNVVITKGFTDLNNTDGGSKVIVSDPIINAAGFDPSSPHYLEGETVPIVRVYADFAVNKAALNWAARIIYNRAVFAEKWWHCVIPCPLIMDPLDTLQVLPRAPRINDLCYVKRNNTLYPAIIRSGNPSWEGFSGEGFQWIHLEGKFRNPETEI